MKEILISLGGLIVGSFLTLIVQFYLSKKQTELSLSEKMIERRINAYNELYEKVKELRFMMPIMLINNEDENEKLKRKPRILLDLESLDDFINKTLDIYNRNSQWFSNDVVKEINYMQDYLLNVRTIFQDLTKESKEVFASDIKDDFIELGTIIDKAILPFYKNKYLKLKEDIGLLKWHKLRKEETLKRINNTILAKKYINQR
jgi:hypothetical protein